MIGNTIAYKDLGIVALKHLEQVDMSSFAPGFYFVEVLTDGNKATKKIIKN